MILEMPQQRAFPRHQGVGAFHRSPGIVFLFPCFTVPWRYVEQPWIVTSKDVHGPAVLGWRTGMLAEAAVSAVRFRTAVFRAVLCSLIAILVHT